MDGKNVIYGETAMDRLVQKATLIAKPKLLESLITEADELVRIFASSIRTAQRNGGSVT